jgi:Peptidase inhibitor family I36
MRFSLGGAEIDGARYLSRPPINRRKHMFSRKNTAMGLVTGIAVAGALIGAALPANAQGHGKAAGQGLASTPGSHSTAPKVKHSVAPSGGRFAQPDSDACYAYSDGTGDLCLWYYYNYSGSRGGIYSNDISLWDDSFTTSGSGQGAIMANNTESFWNYDHIWTAFGCTGVVFTGSCGYAKPWTGGNFSSTFVNNLESVRWSL